MSILRDFRFSIRTLLRRRAFAVLAIGTLAIGIGAATSIYTVVDGILFRPLPFRDPGRLIAVWSVYPHWRGDPILGRLWDRITLSIPEYREWRAGQRSFVDVAITGTNSRALGQGAEREIVGITQASASLLDVLMVRPALGRFFLPQEDLVGGAPVTVLSYENWQSRYGGDPKVLGRPVPFEGGSYIIVGVLPRGLSLSHGKPAAPFWIPVGQDSANAAARTNHSYSALGRIRPGVSLSAAAAEAERLIRGDQKPEQHAMRLETWQADQTREVRGPLLLLFAASGLLLLIACVNVATLILGEAANRKQEIAARVAMGASRFRVLRQLLTEGLVLAGAAAVAGSALSLAGTRLLVTLAPARIPGLPAVQLDLRVLGFAIAVAMLTGVVIGLAPGLTMAEAGPAGILRGASGQSARGRGRLQTVLVAAECSLSLMLLIVAGLVTRSLVRLTAVDPGIQTENVLALRLSLGPLARDPGRLRQFYADAAERLRALPGVAAATATSNPPFGGGWSSSSFEMEGETAPPGREAPKHEAQQRTTLPGYFQVMGIPLLAGRVYDARDNASGASVVVVNQTLASRDFPGQSPLGKRIRWQRKWREIIGVVGDTKFASLSAGYEAMLYAPIAQQSGGLTYLVRGRQDPRLLLGAIRAEFRALDPNVIVTGSDLLSDQVKRASAEERYRAVVIGLFGALAALLAAIGMYGVTSRAVTRRTREIGIRAALGAEAGSVTALMIRQSLRGVAIGAVVGIAGALILSRFLGPFLFQVGPTDPATYLLMLAFLSAVSLAASWIPARRAGRVEPAVVLRGE